MKKLRVSLELVVEASDGMYSWPQQAVYKKQFIVDPTQGLMKQVEDELDAAYQAVKIVLEPEGSEKGGI